MERIKDTLEASGYVVMAVLLQGGFVVVSAVSLTLLDVSAMSPVSVVVLIGAAEVPFAIIAYLYFYNSSAQLLTEEVTKSSTTYILIAPLLALVVGVGFTLLFQELGFSGRPFLKGQEVVSKETRIALVFLSILVIGPAEEYFFRGGLQAVLRESFGLIGTVGVASVLFLLVHVPNVTEAKLPIALASLSGVFAFSLLAGFAYEKTQSLMVPIIMHGAYNAVIFSLPLFVSL